ncbi:hypothetical protein [Vibrio parahaemolyticus]|uniref:hypothetical protein n=1 Tax=Vibrio parahaemolyticus TaxID=670 RepID=UPI00248FE4ED|nr:hypothetical protein [Vibrio parahaemolyticus]
MEQITLFHGSLTSGIDEFRPLSHFGSKLQAFRIMVAKAALDGDKGEPVLYECTMSVNQDQFKMVKDAGSPNHQAICYIYCLNLDLEQEFRELCRKTDKPNGPIWINGINEIAERHNHKLLSYKNVVEGDDLSYCLLDPSIITEIKEKSLSWKEVATTCLKHPDNECRTLEEDLIKINMFLEEMRNS